MKLIVDRLGVRGKNLVEIGFPDGPDHDPNWVNFFADENIMQIVVTSPKLGFTYKYRKVSDTDEEKLLREGFEAARRPEEIDCGYEEPIEGFGSYFKTFEDFLVYWRTK